MNHDILDGVLLPQPGWKNACVETGPSKGMRSWTALCAA